MRHICRSYIFDHLGLVAAMLDALGSGDVMDQATPQHPERRLVTAGTAVNAMGLNGLGLVNHPLDLVPHVFQPQPTARLCASCIDAQPLHDEALGRAWDTLDAHGVTALSRLMAATAARRLRLTPPCAQLARTSGHVDGRDPSAEEPDEQVLHLTRGDSRDQRPDLNHGRRDWIVAPHAGLPVLMIPRSGKSRDVSHVGPVVSQHMAPWPTTSGMTSLVADGALESAEHLQPRSGTRMQWITRVPATWSAAPAARAQAEPQTMGPWMAG